MTVLCNCALSDDGPVRPPNTYEFMYYNILNHNRRNGKCKISQVFWDGMPGQLLKMADFSK
jgi:hypothetical protein